MRGRSGEGEGAGKVKGRRGEVKWGEGEKERAKWKREKYLDTFPSFLNSLSFLGHSLRGASGRPRRGERAADDKRGKRGRGEERRGREEAPGRSLRGRTAPNGWI